MGSVQENNKKIPDFLQDLAKTDTFDTDMAVKQKSSPLLKIYVVISALWFGFLLLYLNFGFGWDNLSALLPDEFIRFFAKWIYINRQCVAKTLQRNENSETEDLLSRLRRYRRTGIEISGRGSGGGTAWRGHAT